MCFSAEADLAVGLALLPVGVLTLREVRRPREVPFAALPLLFAAHQLVEAVVWLGAQGRVSPGLWEAAIMAYLVVALPVLPALVPLGVLLLEPAGARAPVAPFVALGIVVSAHLGWVLATGPVSATVRANAVVYDTGLSNGVLWTMLYIVAVIGPSLLSGYPSIVAFGLLNLAGLTVVALAYVNAFVSLWCVWAALTSALVWLHMVRRRRLPDGQRLRHQPTPPPVAAGATGGGHGAG